MDKEKNILFGILVAAVILTAGLLIYNSNKKIVDGPILEDGKEVETVGNLQIEDLAVGNGAEAVKGNIITVNYKGTLTDGTQFDSSYDRGEPFSFNLGAGQVIQGWEEGFVGMKVGGKRKLTIPPSMGYGSRDMGVIPPNSTLIFEVELLKVE